jgi:broad specificity phosphatase PhoE
VSPPGPSTRFLLARHGQSTWNAEGRWQGRADPPLSELGARQAEDAAAVLRDADGPAGRIDRIWASPLRRAHRTAEIIGAGLDLPVSVDPRLVEVDAGEWTGLTRVDIEAQWPGYLEEHRRPPGFEPRDRLAHRALEAIGEIGRATPGASILVVTHGGVIGAVEGHLDAAWVRTPNLGARIVHDRDGALELGERVLLVDPDDVQVTTPRQV